LRLAERFSASAAVADYAALHPIAAGAWRRIREALPV